MGNLTGYEISIFKEAAETTSGGSSDLAHTYVWCEESERTYKWGCFGREEGGRAICGGAGSCGESDCLAGSDETAGIRYGRTGVCHQCANRILWPSRTLVSKAAGYSISSALYGAYGTDSSAWAKRKSACAGLRLEGEVAGQKPEQRYADQIQAIYQELAGGGGVRAAAEGLPMAVRIAEFSALGELHGIALAPSQMHVAAANLERLGERRAELVAELEGDRITSTRFAGGINGAVAEALESFHESLGAEAYQRLFGIRETRFELVEAGLLESELRRERGG